MSRNFLLVAGDDPAYIRLSRNINSEKIAAISFVNEAFITSLLRNIAITNATKATQARNVRYQAITCLNRTQIARKSVSRQTVKNVSRVLSSVDPEDLR